MGVDDQSVMRGGILCVEKKCPTEPDDKQGRPQKCQLLLPDLTSPCQGPFIHFSLF